jgi:hypothetical protein
MTRILFAGMVRTRSIEVQAGRTKPGGDRPIEPGESPGEIRRLAGLVKRRFKSESGRRSVDEVEGETLDERTLHRPEKMLPT